ncbi:MAG: hypothetical protein CO184_01270 [Candidatus Zambryskibacteria bacterium CG_4_9_14_3_um_filter_40_16]|uniref:Uncharacterized protein n=2 Tax=Candidatus Zambryskiibacteriota TaxID=1817925 RepID=A0A2H0K6T2_9BACT|nr:MAG: hypothetical protein COV95_01360 [Candidatus Zambryskibacteria bacterium CG11_big_fil_rev_8_21_14_0_20_40_24]PJA33704.1 MAG: hypothetical protein CO184_01270 [Candidatus Zambryskibacteria bacterium CG_4_9_14_3_um_filter_40_16]
MKTQTLQEKARSQKEKLVELSKVIHGSQQNCGRDGDVATNPQHFEPVNWNKGWGKYGKT